ncbi:MAG: DUF6588 family protein [Fidelibacterota bacterium]
MNRKTILIAIAITGMIFSQNLEETLQQMAKDNAKGYLGPAATAFGMGVNSGTFHTAKPHKMLGFDFKLNVAATTISDVGQTYTFALPNTDITFPLTLGSFGSFDVSLNPDQIYEADRESSTLFGPAETHEIQVDEISATDAIAQQLAADPNMPLTADEIKSQFGSDISAALDDNVPALSTFKGFDLPAFPMVMPQVSVGLPMSIEVTLRGFPEADMGDMGKLSFYGFGGKIGLNQFIPIPNIALPRIAVGYYITNLSFGDILSANNSIMTLQLSKSIPFLTVYGGVGLESSSIDVSYDYVDELTDTTVPIKFSLDGENSFRTIVGVRLKLAIISINADYNVGEFNTANIGVGLTLR